MLPVHAAWGHGGPIWVTDGGRNQMALFPPSLVFLSLWWSSTSRENSLSRGGGFGTLSGGLAFAERWVTYLEWKTEVEEVSTVAWPWTVAPLPRLGAYLQTAIGSALTIVFVGSETRPRGKQREFVLKRKASGCFLLTRIGTGSLRGRTGGERGPYLNSAFGNAKLSGQSFPGRYPRVGVLLKERLQGVLLAQLQSKPPPSRSSGDGACGRDEREKSQRTWGWERTRRKCPSMLPAQGRCPCASAKPGARGRLCIWRSLGYTPRARLRVKGSGEIPHAPPTPESKEHQQAERKPNPPLKQSWQEIPPTKDQHTIPPVCGDIFPPA